LNERPAEVERLEKMNEYGTDDLFICCASFEERCLSGPLRLAANYRTNFSIIFVLDEPLYKKQVESNLHSLKGILSGKSSKGIFTISCQRDSPVEAIAQLSNIWQRCKPRDPEEPFITIDISGFTKIYLLQLLNYLIIEAKLGLPRMLHTTQSYLPAKLTKGVSQITTVPNFFGDISLGKKTVLVLFLGFEPDRTVAVWKHLNPDRTIALITSPPRHDNLKYVRYAEKNNAFLLSQESVERREVPPDNPYAVRKVLEDIYNEFKGSGNMVVGPFGTKPQVVGLFLFCLEHPKVQVVYSLPVKYTRSYLWRKPGETLMLPLNPTIPEITQPKLVP
jgi:hypothetical protein